MNTLIRQSADICKHIYDAKDITNLASILNAEAEEDYKFFIISFKEYVRFLNDLIYRLEQEQNENNKP